MITINNVPKSYIPYHRLVICSNTLIGGVNVVAIGEVLPLIIGRGDKPRIWLQAVARPDSSDFITIVEESMSTHPAVKVYEDNNVIKVEASGTLVLAIKSTGNDSAEVENLDLRPLGLNMYGTRDSLTVGGSTFSQNTMTGGKVFIGLGKR